MHLLERSLKLASETSDLKAKTGAAQQVKAVSARALAFEQLGAELRLAAGKVRGLREKGVAVEVNAKPTANLRKALRSWRDAVASDPGVVVAADQTVTIQILAPLRALTSSLVTASAAAWRGYVTRTLPAVSEETLSVRERLPAHKSKVEAYRQAYRAAFALGETTPTSLADFERFKTYAAQCNAARAELDGEELPPDVRRFLREASHPEGAALELLTAELLEWLVKNELAMRFKIRAL